MAVMVTKVDTINGVDVYERATGELYACPAGTRSPEASAWGPAADGSGEWFASRWLTETHPVRVADRAAAIRYITEEGNR